MSTRKIIDVAQNFSKYPAGRFVSDGDFSGEAFRNKLLIPILKTNDTATIYLDGTRGYGSSFLEEAFGGLVRLGFQAKTIKSSFDLVTKDTSLISEIFEYIDDEEKRQANKKL